MFIKLLDENDDSKIVLSEMKKIIKTSFIQDKKRQFNLNKKLEECFGDKDYYDNYSMYELFSKNEVMK